MSGGDGPKWLKNSVSGITRQTLYDLGRHYDQYVETERLKAAGIKPQTEWGEPHFKRHGMPYLYPSGSPTTTRWATPDSPDP